MKDITNDDSNNLESISIIKWNKDNWKKLHISQQPNYIERELVNEITDQVINISYRRLMRFISDFIFYSFSFQ